MLHPGRKFLLLSWLPLSLLLLLACAPAGWAQRTTADVLGTVVDPTGAVLQGATITVTNLDTAAEYTAVSDAAGGISFRCSPLDATT